MRYLFCAYTTPGLLYPLVGLAIELRRRGHTVAFVTGKAAEPVVRGVEIERIPRGEPDGDSFRIERWGVPFAVALEVKHIEYALRRFTPDALVANLFALGAHIVSEKCGISVCVMGMAAYLWPRRSERREPFPECVDLARWRYTGMLGHLDAARAVFRLPARDWQNVRYPLLGDLFLVRSVAELELEPSSLPAEVQLVGACEWEPPLDADALWRDSSAQTALSGGPVIYVHHGRMFDEPGFWPPLLAALGSRPVRVFASVGRMERKGGATPANFLVRDHIAQSVVLPHADLVVSGAHSSVALGALTHAVPSVLFPYGGETPDNAARLTRAGCALQLDSRRTTPDVMSSTIDAALEDEGLRRNARRMRDAFRRVSGFRAAADAVESGLLTHARSDGGRLTFPQLNASHSL